MNEIKLIKEKIDSETCKNISSTLTDEFKNLLEEKRYSCLKKFFSAFGIGIGIGVVCAAAKFFISDK